MSRWSAGLVAALVLVGSGCTYMLRADGGTRDDAPRANEVVLSHDARWIACSSNSPHLGTETGTWDLFLRDSRTDTVEQLTYGAVSLNAPDIVVPAAVSDDGDRILLTRIRATTTDDPETYRSEVCVWNRR